MTTEKKSGTESARKGRPAKKKWQRQKKDPIVIDLSCGSVAHIEPGLGKHMVEAQKLMGGDQSKFLPALMSQLVKIDGESLVMEDFINEMDIIAYQEIMEHFTDVNFPTDQKK